MCTRSSTVRSHREMLCINKFGRPTRCSELALIAASVNGRRHGLVRWLKLTWSTSGRRGKASNKSPDILRGTHLALMNAGIPWPFTRVWETSHEYLMSHIASLLRSVPLRNAFDPPETTRVSKSCETRMFDNSLALRAPAPLHSNSVISPDPQTLRSPRATADPSHEYWQMHGKILVQC